MVHVNVCALCKFSILIFMILPWLVESLTAGLYYCKTLESKSCKGLGGIVNFPERGFFIGWWEFEEE